MAHNDLGQLVCTVCMEQLTDSGEVRKKSVHRNTTLVLGRNEFRDVMLRMELAKKPLSYRVQDLNVFKKFAKEGKATIKLLKQNIQLLLSNCPPDKLIMFLKTMTTKVECLRMKGIVSERKRLFSNAQREFTEISPLTVKELQTVHNARAEKVEKSEIFTPKGKSMKRKRPNSSDEKENVGPKGTKIQRNGKCLSGLGLGGIPKVVNPVILSKEQQRVLDVVLSGSSVFFTGSAGTGKSFLLKRIIGALAPQHTFATASTGVAACHIGGTTLHAFAGIGSGKASLEQCVELAMRSQVAQTWKKCRHLIIDEVSMVDGELFEKLEVVARMVRQNNEPFGGIQLILCGDFLQLPPVIKGNTKKRKFAFQTSAWRRCVERSMELKSVRRQSDPKFISILNHIRMGRCPQEVTDTLTNTAYNKIDRDGILATRLCTHKEDVDQINDYRLNKLPGTSRVFEACDSDESLAKTIDVMCPVRSKLQLKTGAQVMLAKNLDVQRGLVNGARGVVTGFEGDVRGYPIVKFLCGEEVPLRAEKWVFKMSGGTFLSRRQLPLKLAWAISIHKSQGMSLDCVEMSLSKVFECGQAYVALSRARSLQGLRVLDFDRNCVKADPTVLRFYEQMNHDLRDQSVRQSSQSFEEKLDHW